MWIYRQDTGELLREGVVEGVGYSGAGEGKNNPAMQKVHGVGPIPQGTYTIKEPINTLRHGPYVLPLEPALDNDMFGRSEFLIHGDSKTLPGTASKGCVIMSRLVREKIWESGDRTFSVI